MLKSLKIDNNIVAQNSILDIMISSNEEELQEWAFSLQELRLLKNVITRDITRFQDQTRNLSNWNEWISYVFLPEPEEKKQ